MKRLKSGFTALNALIALVVLLMAALLALKVVSDRNSAKLDARRSAVPAAPDEEGQPLPDTAAAPVDTPVPADPAAGIAKVPVDVPESACLREFKRSPDSLLSHFIENFDSIFVRRGGQPEDEKMFGLLSDYAVCSILGGGRFPCAGNLNPICITAGYYEFLNSSLNNTPEDGICARFVKDAFANTRISPDFCQIAAAALSKRKAPSCKKLGDIEDCEASFVFLKGRNACRAVAGRNRKECLLSAALASGETVSPEGWLTNIMRSRNRSVCIPLAEKLADSYCKSQLRQEVVSERRAFEAADEKRIADMKRALRGKAGRGR
ncbi:MAG: hypothetical protein A2X28_00420 [Elusimicrobia bacterium GWA2_56_46]|nr:MAG: hypothetical protein A2X28_00420 [Elusimicrobia bacterium GWA2_56_46]OGR55832.1 MAG: hypothetical protein A2X39_05795 [Elusimicrobia bacterium GWC2_56_31]HBB65823.1 hypothetical protein [Elusimicrobiota bacterium]HBW22236.1 hypothetical protein [Elusimicrobiota bacterium]